MSTECTPFRDSAAGRGSRRRGSMKPPSGRSHGTLFGTRNRKGCWMAAAAAGAVVAAQSVISRALVLLALRGVLTHGAWPTPPVALARLAAALRRTRRVPLTRHDELSFVRYERRSTNPVRAIIEREARAITERPALARTRFGVADGTALWDAVEAEAADQDELASFRLKRRAAKRAADHRNRSHANLSVPEDAPTRLRETRETIAAQIRWRRLGDRDRLRLEGRDWRVFTFEQLARRVGFTTSQWPWHANEHVGALILEWRGSRFSGDEDAGMAPDPSVRPHGHDVILSNELGRYVKPDGKVKLSRAVLTLPQRASLAMDRATRLTIATERASGEARARFRADRDRRLAGAVAEATAATAQGSDEDAREWGRAAGRIRREKLPPETPHALTDVALLLARPVALTAVADAAADAGLSMDRLPAGWRLYLGVLLRTMPGSFAKSPPMRLLERGLVCVQQECVTRLISVEEQPRGRPMDVSGGRGQTFRCFEGRLEWGRYPLATYASAVSNEAWRDAARDAVARAFDNLIDRAANDAADVHRLATAAGVPTPSVPEVRRGVGSAARSRMPDGTIVENRSERFAVNIDALRTFAATHGHLFPRKQDKPRGINLYVFLQRLERAWQSDTLPAHRRAVLDALPEWHARLRGERPRTV